MNFRTKIVQVAGFACCECDGAGEVPARPVSCNHSGNCPCGVEFVPCTADGCMDGLMACEGCGDHPAKYQTDAGDYCPVCTFRWVHGRWPSGAVEAPARAAS